MTAYNHSESPEFDVSWFNFPAFDSPPKQLLLFFYPCFTRTRHDFTTKLAFRRVQQQLFSNDQRFKRSAFRCTHLIDRERGFPVGRASAADDATVAYGHGDVGSGASTAWSGQQEQQRGRQKQAHYEHRAAVATVRWPPWSAGAVSGVRVCPLCGGKPCNRVVVKRALDG